MANSHPYDYEHSIFSTIPTLFDNVFDDAASIPENFLLTSSFDLIPAPRLVTGVDDQFMKALENDSTTNPDGFTASNRIPLISPPQFTDAEEQILAELERAISPNVYKFSELSIDPPLNLLGTSLPEVNINKYEVEALEIIAHPAPTYRPRYESEINPERGGANRFIRAENERQLNEYPTIKIPSWCQSNHQLYVRITLVTVTSDEIPVHCIHPYPISTSDQNTIHDPANNTIYFRLNENEYRTREKSFHIMILKKKQDHLQTSGPMRLFDLEQCGNINLENPSDSRHKIQLYQLDKSRFVFTLARRQGNSEEFSLHYDTSVYSKPMIEKVDAISNSSKSHLQTTITDRCICVPQKSIWEGGEKVVIIMSRPIKKLEEYSIAFNFGVKGIQTVFEMELINTITILFQTPPCPFPATDKTQKVPILVHKNQSCLFLIDFEYTPSIQAMMKKRAFTYREEVTIQPDYKRLKNYEEQEDCANNLVPQMDRSSTKIADGKSRSHSTLMLANLNEDILKSLDQRLRPIKLAMEDFVRTTDPSALFRAAGSLLSRHTGDSSPLHDAIQNGHTEMALRVIKQTITLPPSKNLLVESNANGETPLLVAAKLNQSKIIEMILKARPNFAKQRDKHGSNIFHLLANLSDDQGAETLEKVLAILSEELNVHLVNEENQQNQKPIDIAGGHNNTSCLKLFNTNENNSE